MATFRDVRRERRNARDRINYYLKKSGLGIRYSQLGEILPKIPKNASFTELENLVKLFKAWTSGRIKEYVAEMVATIDQSIEDFDEGIGPTPFSNIDAYSDMLHGLHEELGETFDRYIDYLLQYSGLDETEIEFALDDNPEYFEDIKKYWEIYEDSKQGRNSKFYGSLRRLRDLMTEVFHVYAFEYGGSYGVYG